MTVLDLRPPPGDTASAYLALGLSEDLREALVASHAVRLLASERRVGGAYVVAGSVSPTSRGVRIVLRMERRVDGEILWSRSVEPSTRDLITAGSDLAGEILHSMGRGPARQAPHVGEVDPVAYQLYLRGRYYLPHRKEADTQQAVELFEQAIARDSGFAPAWAGLASALSWAKRWSFTLEGLPAERVLTRELEASDRALQLDSTSVTTWLLRATVARDVDPTGSRPILRAIRRALAIDSLSEPALDAMAGALADSGDLAGAAATLEHLVSLDPEANVTYLGQVLYWRREFDAAASWADRAIDAFPAGMYQREVAGEIALAQGRLEQADAQFSIALGLGAGPERIRALSGRAQVAAKRRDSVVARGFADQAETLASRAPPNEHWTLSVAEAWAALGEWDRALSWLERYTPRGDLHFQLHLRCDASLDPLRGNPRFAELLKAGL